MFNGRHHCLFSKCLSTISFKNSFRRISKLYFMDLLLYYITLFYQTPMCLASWLFMPVTNIWFMWSTSVELVPDGVLAGSRTKMADIICRTARPEEDDILQRRLAQHDALMPSSSHCLYAGRLSSPWSRSVHLLEAPK